MDHDFYLIEQYLAGQLEGEALNIFQKRLEENVELQQQLSLLQDIDVLEEIKSDVNLQAEFERLGKIHFLDNENTKEKGRSRLIALWLPALVAGLAGAFLVLALYLAIQPPFHSRAYAQFAHNELSIIQKDQKMTDIVRMERAYNSRQYATATPLLQQYLDENPKAENVRLALGISQLEQQEYTAARVHFNHLHQGNSSYKNEGTLYLALSFLKENHLGKCKVYLEKIPKDFLQYDKVEDLLHKIEGRTSKLNN